MQKYNDDHLDKLLKSATNGMWKPEDEEPYYDALDKVNKRFNIIRHKTKPKCDIIAFYSHENDLFSGNEYENLFNDNETFEESETGYSIKNDSLLPSKYNPTHNFIGNVDLSGNTVVDAINIINDCIRTHVSTNEVIKLNTILDNWGERKVSLGVNIFTPVFMDSLNRKINLLVDLYFRCHRNNTQFPWDLKFITELLMEISEILLVEYKDAIMVYIDTTHNNSSSFNSLKTLVMGYAPYQNNELDEMIYKANGYMNILSRETSRRVGISLTNEKFRSRLWNILEKYFRYSEYWSDVDEKIYPLLIELVECLLVKLRNEPIVRQRPRFSYGDFKSTPDIEFLEEDAEINMTFNVSDLYPKLEELPKRHFAGPFGIWR